MVSPIGSGERALAGPLAWRAPLRPSGWAGAANGYTLAAVAMTSRGPFLPSIGGIAAGLPVEFASAEYYRLRTVVSGRVGAHESSYPDFAFQARSGYGGGTYDLQLEYYLPDDSQLIVSHTPGATTIVTRGGRETVKTYGSSGLAIDDSGTGPTGMLIIRNVSIGSHGALDFKIPVRVPAGSAVAGQDYWIRATQMLPVGPQGAANYIIHVTP